jgi:hypothetical protein
MLAALRALFTARVGMVPPRVPKRPATLGAVCGLQPRQLGQLGSQAGVTGCGGTGDERLRDRTESTELFLNNSFWSHRPSRCQAGTAVMLV